MVRLEHVCCARAEGSIAGAPADDASVPSHLGSDEQANIARARSREVLLSTTIIATLSVDAHERVAREHPVIEFSFLRELVRASMSTLSRLPSFALVQLAERQPLYIAGQRLTHVDLVCSGRVVAVCRAGHGTAARALIRRGELVDMRGALVGARAQHDMVATRATNILRIPTDAYAQLMARDRTIFRQTILRLLSESRPRATHRGWGVDDSVDLHASGRATRYQTVMLAPAYAAARELVPYFASRLRRALEAQGARVLVVGWQLVAERFSADLHNRPELSALLDQLEDRAEYLLFLPNARGTAWWDACTMHADLIVSVAAAAEWREGGAGGGRRQPFSRRNESVLASELRERPDLFTPDRLLALVHFDDRAAPSGTRDALDAFGCSDHRHIL
jgi:CRP-like cAMP-binding protein